jgi:signal transduction histidine kinase
MNRAFFLQLLAIVLLVVVGEFSLLKFFDLWRPHMEAIEKHRAAGVIELLVEQIDDLPVTDQQQRLQLLQKNFGYDIGLSNKAMVTLSARQVTELNAGQIVFNEKRFELYRQLQNGRLLVVSNMDSPAQHLQSLPDLGIVGSIKLLQRILSKTDEAQWGAVIDKINPEGAVKLQLQDLTQVELNSEETRRLQQGELVYIETTESQAVELPAEIIYQRIGGSQKVVKIGPITPFITDLVTQSLIMYFSLLGMLITMPLLLWFLPTWISAYNLNRAKEKFGRSELQVRIKSVFASNLNPLVSIFNRMAEKIEASLSYNNILAHAISHELRTPLTSFEFALELFNANKSQNNRKKQLRRMKTCVQELEAMACELSDYARFDQQELKLDPCVSDINEFLVAIANKWQATSKSVVLSLTLGHHDRLSRFDSYFLGRAVDNLLRNGFTYADKRIHIYLDQTSDACRICIENDGKPIPQEDKKRLFDPFVRLDDSRDKDSGGTGLGLTIVAQIVKAHHGKVWVEDSELGGAKFVIQIASCME